MIRKISAGWDEWGRKPLSMRVFIGMTGFAALCFFAILFVCNVYDSDMHFLLETGREIVENGIPRENPWAADAGLAFVAQQWLYDVILYGVEQAGGSVGFSLFVASEFAVLAVVLWALFRERGISGRLYLLSLLVIAMSSQSYMFNVRPQLVTMILLALECLCIERFMVTGTWVYLIGLPVTMFLEMNVHMSMWPFHFCVLAAYAVPAFYLPKRAGVIQPAGRGRFGPVLLFTLISVGAMWLNPYGTDGVAYLVRSWTARTFDYVAIVELQPAGFASGAIVNVLVAGALAVVCWKLGCLSSVSVNFFAGFGLITLIATRNQMFMLFPVTMLMRDFCQKLPSVGFKIDWKSNIRNNLIPVLLGADILFLAGFCSSIDTVFLSDTGRVSEIDAAIAYISERWDEDENIFGGIMCGAQMEHAGLKNIYIDARPEIWMSELNGKRDVLVDYSRYCAGVASGAAPAAQRDAWPDGDEMKAWLDEYDFQFICVYANAEARLAGYMLTDTDYRRVDEASGSEVILYERVD